MEFWIWKLTIIIVTFSLMKIHSVFNKCLNLCYKIMCLNMVIVYWTNSIDFITVCHLYGMPICSSVFNNFWSKISHSDGIASFIISPEQNTSLKLFELWGFMFFSATVPENKHLIMNILIIKMFCKFQKSLFPF